MSEVDLHFKNDDAEFAEVSQDVFLLGLLRAYAETAGLPQSVLTTQFDPLAAQMLMMLDELNLKASESSVSHTSTVSGWVIHAGRFGFSC